MSPVSLPISTERLILRTFVDADLDALHELHSHPDVVRYLEWGPWSREDARQALAKRKRRTDLAAEGDVLGLAVQRRDTGAVIGEVILTWVSRQHRQGEVGFALHPDHHRTGFGREAAAAILGVGFEEFGLHRIFGSCDADNVASAGLMRHLGMRHEARLLENHFIKGEWRSEDIFAIRAHEWTN